MQIHTNIQATAIRVQLGILVTIYSLYSSRNHELTENNLQDLIRQLPPLFIILDDFNAYHARWGCTITDCRGRVVENVIYNENLNILNTGAHTRICYNSESAIDLSIVTPILLNPAENDQRINENSCLLK